MALIHIAKIHSNLTNKTASCAIARSFACKKSKKGGRGEKEEDPCCPSRACKTKKPKKSIWSIFKSKDQSKAKAQPEKPPIETCRKQIRKRIYEPDPDLSEFEGTPYRTCGTAYVIQSEQVSVEEPSIEPEDKIIEKIEKHPDLKNVEDPMPPFESVELRLINLSEKRLHPLYRRYLSMPKRPSPYLYPKQTYQSRSGPINADEIPAHLKFNKECLEKKNIFSEFKRAEPPRQLLAKMLEMKKNQRPTLERKNEPCPAKEKDVSAAKAMKMN